MSRNCRVAPVPGDAVPDGGPGGSEPASAQGAAGKAAKADEIALFDQKVVELASRGLTLAALLDFFRVLLDGKAMPHFDPNRSTTEDVVRGAIIPLSAERACAFSQIMMKDEPCFPKHMVTHNWQNTFCHLVAAVVGHATGRKYYYCLVPRMQCVAVLDDLIEELRRQDVLGRTYWICALSVNQHISICSSPTYADILATRRQVQVWLSEGILGVGADIGSAEPVVALQALEPDGQPAVRQGTPLQSCNGTCVASLEELGKALECMDGPSSELTLRFCWGRDTVTRRPFEACKCGTERQTSGPLSEMDKFTAMMRHLQRLHGRDFGQVVSMDRWGQVVTRAWVVAEIFEVYNTSGEQKITSFFPAPLCERRVRGSLRRVKLQDCQASVPADKIKIMASITDIEGCNRQVRNIVFRESERFWMVRLVLAILPISLVCSLAACTYVVWSLSDRESFYAMFWVMASALTMTCCLLPLSLLGDAYITLIQDICQGEIHEDDKLVEDVLGLVPRFWWNRCFLAAFSSRLFRWFILLYLRRIRWVLRLLALPLLLAVAILLIVEFAT